MIRYCSIRALLLRILGMALCCVPVAVCILLYFPLWRNAGAGAFLSGFTVLLLSLSVLPFYKSIKRFLESAAVYTLWLVAFVLFFCLARIADEMTVISFVGFIGNLLGAFCFKLAERGVRSKEINNG